MLLTTLFSEYPNLFSFGDYVPASKVELNFAGFNKSDINAVIENGDLVVSAKNKDRKDKRYRILIGRDVSEDDLSLKYSHGLLTVELKPKKEDKKDIPIE